MKNSMEAQRIGLEVVGASWVLALEAAQSKPGDVFQAQQRP
jgi:hypothetical protein